MKRLVAMGIVTLTLALVGGIALARRGSVAPPRSVDDIRYDDGRACWSAPAGPGGCNTFGCWKNGGGCNIQGCWNGPRGMCNVYGCSDVGTCSVHGCPHGKVRARHVCVDEDDLVEALGFDPDGGGACNLYGCWEAGGGCNIHGCWGGPYGACNVHGCSDEGVCSVYGCPGEVDE